jgi:DnaK suppressor protein
MDAKKIKDARARLTSEQEKLLQSLKRSQLAAEEIKLEKTEDEGDLASLSHDRDVLYNLHEGSFARLQLIEKAIEAIDSGRYGECVRCGEDINPKRLSAVPWAAMCIGCQEAVETEAASSGMVTTGVADEAKP